MISLRGRSSYITHLHTFSKLRRADSCDFSCGRSAEQQLNVVVSPNSRRSLKLPAGAACQWHAFSAGPDASGHRLGPTESADETRSGAKTYECAVEGSKAAAHSGAIPLLSILYTICVIKQRLSPHEGRAGNLKSVCKLADFIPFVCV